MDKVKKSVRKLRHAVSTKNSADFLENFEYIEQIICRKVVITKQIYKLIQSICRDHRKNEKYTYRLIHNFLYQAQHIKEATDCIISITTANRELLQLIGEELTAISDEKLIRELSALALDTKYSASHRNLGNVTNSVLKMNQAQDQQTKMNFLAKVRILMKILTNLIAKTDCLLLINDQTLWKLEQAKSLLPQIPISHLCC